MGKPPAKQKKGIGRKVAMELPIVVDDMLRDTPAIDTIIELPAQHVQPVLDDHGPFVATEYRDDDLPNVEDNSFEMTNQSIQDPVVESQRIPDVTLPLGTRLVQGLRKSNTIASRLQVQVNRIAVNKAIKKYGDLAKGAITKEVKQVLDKRVFEFVLKRKLNGKQLSSVIRSSMFLKEKLDYDGLFSRLKARLVAGGNGQDKSEYIDICSPTVSGESVMMVLAIASAEDRHKATCDVTVAFLESEIPDDQEVIMQLDPVTTMILKQLEPSALPYVESNGQC